MTALSFGKLLEIQIYYIGETPLLFFSLFFYHFCSPDRWGKALQNWLPLPNTMTVVMMTTILIIGTIITAAKI